MIPEQFEEAKNIIIKISVFIVVVLVVTAYLIGKYL